MLKFNFKKKNTEVHKAYMRLFATGDGKVVLQDLVEYCKVNKSCFDSNQLEMARMEGERNVALRILSILSVDAEDMLKMLDDNKERNSSYYEDILEDDY